MCSVVQHQDVIGNDDAGVYQVGLLELKQKNKKMRHIPTWEVKIMITTDTLFGYAETDITPEKPIELIGFNRDNNTSQGILDRLISQVVIVKKSLSISCIVTIDSIGFTIEDTNILREHIAVKLGINLDNVMICFSHTHAAPNNGKERDYFICVLKKVLDCVDEAIKTLTHIKAVWGHTEADIGINRRNDKGVLDRRIGILKIVDAHTEELMLILLRITAHANVLTRDNYLVSSDYFGKVRELLSQKYRCNVLVTQGASGNVEPKYKGTVDDLDRMSNDIVDAVSKIMGKLCPEDIERVGIFSEIESFHSEVPTIEKAKIIAEEAMKECMINGEDWLNEVNSLLKQNIRKQTSDIEIQYFILNNGCWCGIAEEAMSEIALNISSMTNDPQIYFSGYTNGCGGYLPTLEEHRLGGYEVLYSYLLYYKYHKRVMPLNNDTAKKISEKISKTWSYYKYI